MILSPFAGAPDFSTPRYWSVATFWITQPSSCLMNFHYIVIEIRPEGGLGSHCESYPLVILSVTIVAGDGPAVTEDEV